MLKEFKNDIKFEHLNEEHQAIANLIGLKNFLKLVDFRGGSFLYIPQLKTISRETRNAAIRSEFNGDYQELALKYSLTQRQIKYIINNK